MKKLMKYIGNMAAALMLAAMSSCSDEIYEPLSDDVVDNGDGTFTITVGVDVPEMTDETATTRSFGEYMEDPSSATIKFLAFDENSLLTDVYEGEYVSASECENSATEAHKYHVYYKVTMRETDEKRKFHVLVNHNALEIKDIKLGTESDVFNASNMIVSEGTCVYWDKFEVSAVNADVMKTKLQHLHLIRNFCKLALNFNTEIVDSEAQSYSAAETLQDVQWGLMRYSRYGSVAPYINNQAFAEYFVEDSDGDDHHAQTSSYKALNAQKYYGHIPRNTNNANNFYILPDETYVDKIDWVDGDQALYCYENEGSSGSSLWKKTMVFIRGHYVTKDISTGAKVVDSDWTYYRVSLVDEKQNYVDLNLLRNICYEITIDKITDRGFDTAVEAYTRASGNNISGSTATSSYPSVTSGTAALRVEYMKKYILTHEAFTMLYRYVPDVTSTDPTTGVYHSKNTLVELQQASANADGSFSATTLESPIKIEDFAIASFVQDTTITAGTNNYSTITFTPAVARTDGLETRSTVRVQVTDKSHPELYRDVEFILRPRYLMKGEEELTKLKITMDEDGADVPNYTCTVAIPANLPDELFPLTFTFETYPSCTYPNADLSIMQVSSTDGSIFDQTLKQYFHYHRDVTRTAYKNVLKEHGYGGFVETDDGYKLITFFFKINPTVLTLAGSNEIRFGVYCNTFSPTPYDDVANERATYIQSVYTYDSTTKELTFKQ